jgi:hypothetical protein
MDKGIMFVYTNGCPKIHFKKSTTNQNRKGKDYTFKDFTPDCVQNMAEPTQRKGKNNSTVDEKLSSKSKAPTQNCHTTNHW